MSSEFLSGVLAAWSVAQIAVTAFFVVAYTLRREAEYLLFSLTSASLALATAGIAYHYAVQGYEQWLQAARLAHAGAIAATAFNLHFVMRYTGTPYVRSVAVSGYVLAGLFEVLNLTPLWWPPGALSAQTVGVWGEGVRLVVADPTALAISFYAVAVVQFGASAVLVVRAWLRGNRELLAAVIGSVVAAAAVPHDIALFTGVGPESVYLLPHGFLIYAFAVAISLLVRYSGVLEQAASSLREKTEALRHSHVELQQMQDELVVKQQLAAVGELAAMIAHEVRNPLAIIVNATSGLRRSGLKDDDRKTLLDIVEEETARLNRLVTDLLRFARPVNVQRAEVALPELVQRAEGRAGSQHEVRLEIAPDEELREISVDPNLLRLVFDNLVDNALQAMPEGGTLTVAVSRSDYEGVSCARIDIQDSGHGMEDQTLKRATDPFFTTRPSGTGLGLPIVQRILEAHGGRVELDSREGQGTTVRLLLPLDSSQALPISDNWSMFKPRKPS